MIEILYPAFILGIALVFIHSVFGLEIIKRGVIFTDLAIGQFASIGMAISIAFLDTKYQTPLTFLGAFLGAVIITWATKKVQKIEAFIGLLYAFGISSIMLILAKSSSGVELYSKLSASDILFTSSDELYKSLILYSFVSMIMFFIYPKLKGTLKEFVFFLMLAITVTSSVQSAGVLVVFALLIAPSYAGLLQNIFKPFWFASIFGSIGIITALALSYNFDLPTGYTIIFITVLSSMIFVVYQSFLKTPKSL